MADIRIYSSNLGPIGGGGMEAGEGAKKGSQAIVHAIFRGVVDSLKGTVAIFYLDTKIRERLQQQQQQQASPAREQTSGRRKDLLRRDSMKALPGDEVQPKVMKRVLECCVLNGGVCLCSILFFYGALLPFLNYVFHVTFGDSSSVGKLVWGWLKMFLSWIFSIFWVLPLLLLSKVVNSLWFQDIADWAFRYKRGRPQQLSSISKMIADSLFSVLVQALFLGQTLVVGLLPIVFLGDLLSFVHLCMLYSLYAFEYKWCNMGWELHQRLTFIENNWPYFIGFGLPLAVVTSLHSSYIIRLCFISNLFSLFLLSSGTARTCPVKLAHLWIKLFSLVIFQRNILLLLKPHALGELVKRAWEVENNFQVQVLLDQPKTTKAVEANKPFEHCSKSPPPAPPAPRLPNCWYCPGYHYNRDSMQRPAQRPKRMEEGGTSRVSRPTTAELNQTSAPLKGNAIAYGSKGVTPLAKRGKPSKS
ncbi:hypothetical protein PR048_001093 [Dryococelus australis]|uniref:Etoposide-induced protein 2.4 homolog n=1 Tax=Dryococelus australis TaxID=614101 RepID=A0ABQ9IGE6_9NEOP|nr:hypothetical protein PR048_001093 [Dryococelus australis]